MNPMRINNSIEKHLQSLKQRYQTIETAMGDNEIIANPEKYQAFAKEFSDLSPIISTYNHFLELQDTIKDNKDLLKSDDPEIKELALEEQTDLEKQIKEIEQNLCILLLPKDPDDQCNAFIEIRAGAGGLEAGLFVSNLLRMYLRYAEIQRWKTTIISSHENESGGYKEIIIRVSGSSVYEVLKYESGTHRVQRIPSTESQGRIHTSTCTVAVMPEITLIDHIEINPSDLRIDTYRASGAGGQHVNKTDSAVRITHLPTDTVVECQEERSQHKNKAKALQLLQTKILSAQAAQQKAEEAKQRKLLVGSGDRSERIRTYNFPQGRLTDHRINLTLYSLSEIMEGGLEQVVTPLRQEDQLQQMSEFNSNG